MDSITQLLDLIKSLQTYIFTFSTQLEPLLLAKEIPDSLARQINSLEFIQLIDDCSKTVERLSDFINVLNPEMAKLIKKLLKKPKESKDRMIPYADFTVDGKHSRLSV